MRKCILLKMSESQLNVKRNKNSYISTAVKTCISSTCSVLIALSNSYGINLCTNVMNATLLLFNMLRKYSASHLTLTFLFSEIVFGQIILLFNLHSFLEKGLHHRVIKNYFSVIQAEKKNLPANHENSTVKPP